LAGDDDRVPVNCGHGRSTRADARNGRQAISEWRQDP